MPRAKRGFKKKNRRVKILKLAKGYWGARSSNYRTAKEAVEHALLYAYRDRRAKKRDFRRLWIIRIKAAAKLNGLTYSRFIQGLKKLDIDLDRKVLAEIAVSAPQAFGRIAAKVKDAAAQSQET
jgi:large subunit ribosomal protein L20